VLQTITFNVVTFYMFDGHISQLDNELSGRSDLSSFTRAVCLSHVPAGALLVMVVTRLSHLCLYS